jgi:hypothetical protein
MMDVVIDDDEITGVPFPAQSMNKTRINIAGGRERKRGGRIKTSDGWEIFTDRFGLSWISIPRFSPS